MLFNLTVTIVQIDTRKPYGPLYSWQQGERKEVYLRVTALDEQGHKVYFSAGAITQTVTSAPGIAVVIFEKSNDWLEAPENYHVTSGVPAPDGAGVFIPKVEVGDKIKVGGRIKKVYPNGDYQLHFVRRT